MTNINKSRWFPIAAIILIVGGSVWYIGEIQEDDQPIPPPELYAFRNACIPDGVVVCDGVELTEYLENETVSKVWWYLTTDERKAVATRTIGDWQSKYYHGSCTQCIGGLPNCMGAVDCKQWLPLQCAGNAAIRYCWFNGKTIHVTDEWSTHDRRYFITSEGDEYCFVTETPYNLPVYQMSIACSERNLYHSVAAILVDIDTCNINSWIFFQYDDIDIQTGSWHIPFNSSLYVKDPSEQWQKDAGVVKWQITKNGAVKCLECKCSSMQRFQEMKGGDNT